jgi:hypothetical protein
MRSGAPDTVEKTRGAGAHQPQTGGRARRGRPLVAELRTIVINVWCTPEEFLELDAHAAAAGYGSPLKRVARMMRAAALLHVRRPRET